MEKGTDTSTVPGLTEAFSGGHSPMTGKSKVNPSLLRVKIKELCYWQSFV